MNLQEIMQAAATLQNKMQEAQASLDKITVTGASGAGLVTADVNGKGRITRLSIDPSLFRAEEKEIVEDLIVAAIADAQRKADSQAQDEMGKVTQGMPLPPGMKLPF